MDRDIVFQDLTKPQDLHLLKEHLRELYDFFDPLYTTTAPNGNISAQRGKMAIYFNDPTYQAWMNVDGDKVWLQLG